MRFKLFSARGVLLLMVGDASRDLAKALAALDAVRKA
jgi:hypothetical protein